MRLDEAIVAVVTGGGSGLGEATARALAQSGVRVAIFDRDSDRGEAVAADIGGLFCRVDVTAEAEVAAGFARAREKLGQERILVNCAGVAVGEKVVSRDKTDPALVRAHDMRTFERVIGVNLVGSFRTMTLAAQGMLGAEPLADGERGVIINTASVAAQDGQVGQAAYAASKGAILAMALPAARDMMNEGVRVNTILPGIMMTPMMSGMPENVQQSLAASIPFPKRLGHPAEYASLALEICRNTYLNGAAIRLDGAIRMAPR